MVWSVWVNFISELVMRRLPRIFSSEFVCFRSSLGSVGIVLGFVFVKGGPGLMYVWASGHLGFWASGHLGIWASGHRGFWASRHLGF